MIIDTDKIKLLLYEKRETFEGYKKSRKTDEYDDELRCLNGFLTTIREAEVVSEYYDNERPK